MATATFNKKKILSHQAIGLKFTKETGKVLHLKFSCVWWWNLDTAERRSEIPGKFWNV